MQVVDLLTVCIHMSSQLCVTIECRRVVDVWRCSPISFKHVSLWCLLLDPRQRTAYRSNMRVWLERSNHTMLAYLCMWTHPLRRWYCSELYHSLWMILFRQCDSVNRVRDGVELEWIGSQSCRGLYYWGPSSTSHDGWEYVDNMNLKLMERRNYCIPLIHPTLKLGPPLIYVYCHFISIDIE